MAEYYRHSGTVPVGGLLFTACAGVLVSAPIAFAYSYGIAYMPIAIINELFTFALGFAVGAVVAMAARAGAIRNAIVPTVIGLACGVSALYVAWGADSIARLGWPNDSDVLARFEPDFVRAYLRVFYSKGFWRIGFGKGDNQTGIMLAIVWFFEAAVVIGLATYLPWTAISDSVYCERCRRWARHSADAMRVCVTSTDWLRSEVENGSVGLLCTSRKATASDRQFVKVGIAFCDRCGETNCLDLWTVEVKVDKEGQCLDKPKHLVRKLIVSHDSMALLLDAVRPG